MSGFKFGPSNTKLKYNFLLSNIKYKFSIKEKPAWYLNELYSFYLDKNFSELNTRLEKFYSGNVFFLLEEDCKLVLNCFRKLLLIRNFIRKKMFYIDCNSLELSNETDLSYNTINLQDDNILTLINCNKYKYAFRISEVINLYKYALFNHDDEISEPVVVKNPYTGENLKIHQHYTIYQHILEYYCRKKKCLPEFYLIFKNSYFNIRKFYCKYYVQLSYNAINNYVKDMDFRQWVFSLSEYVSNQTFFCQKCFRTKTNVRQIFSNSLQLFMLNDIDMFSYGDGLDKFIELCKKNSLYFQKNHNHKNVRPVFNQRRRGRTLRISESNLSHLNLTPLPPLAPLDNLPSSTNSGENEENEENYEQMRDIHTFLSDDENIIVNLSDNADAIIHHTLMDIIDKIEVS
tara:strand:- start:543 stop:1748 length:1206 start_codon:yes stop_codon:yes gene_type:complete